jgi:hypothetical protein
MLSTWRSFVWPTTWSRRSNASACKNHGDNPAEEMPEGHDHGQNLIETRRVNLVSKSFIPRVHEVLTRDNTELEQSLRACATICVPLVIGR